MSNGIFLVLCFCGGLYYPIKYLVLCYKYKNNYPPNDYDKRILKESKDNSKKYFPLVVILSLYFLFNYSSKTFFTIINVKEEDLIISNLDLGNSYEEISIKPLSKGSNNYNKTIDLFNSTKYRKLLFKPNLDGTSKIELFIKSNNTNSSSFFVYIPDGKYIEIQKRNIFNLISYKYYKINKSINLSDEILKILE